jgi:hypothetical protein
LRCWAKDEEGKMAKQLNGKKVRVVLEPARHGKRSPAELEAAVKKVKAILRERDRRSADDGTK